MRISSLIARIEDTVINTAARSATLCGIKTDATNLALSTSQAVCRTQFYATTLAWKTKVCKRIEGIKE